MDYLTCLGHDPTKASIRIIASSSSRSRDYRVFASSSSVHFTWIFLFLCLSIIIVSLFLHAEYLPDRASNICTITTKYPQITLPNKETKIKAELILNTILSSLPFHLRIFNYLESYSLLFVLSTLVEERATISEILRSSHFDTFLSSIVASSTFYL